MRFFLTLFCLCISLWLNAQFTCPVTSYSLTSTELGAISNNTTSYTYSAAGFSMPYSVVIQKVAGNGPNLYRYTSTTGVWIGRDDDDESIQPPVQEYIDVVITFSGNVSSGGSIDFTNAFSSTQTVNNTQQNIRIPFRNCV
jgi:hypothetical protein